MIYTVANTSAQGKPVNVYVNGRKVNYAVFADTEKGEVIYYPEPIRRNDKGDEILSQKLCGTVTVEPMK